MNRSRFYALLAVVCCLEGDTEKKDCLFALHLQVLVGVTVFNTFLLYRETLWRFSHGTSDEFYKMGLVCVLCGTPLETGDSFWKV